MSAAFDVMAFALYVICLVGSVSVFVDAALHYCSGNIHNLICNSLPSFHTILLL